MDTETAAATEGASSKAAAMTAATEPEPVGDVKDPPQHPWPYLTEFFSVLSVNRNTYRLQCLLCDCSAALD